MFKYKYSNGNGCSCYSNSNSNTIHTGLRWYNGYIECRCNRDCTINICLGINPGGDIPGVFKYQCEPVCNNDIYSNCKRWLLVNNVTSAVTVNVNPLPTASVQETGPITICFPATQLLTAVTDAAVPGYQWTLNGNNISLNGTGSTYPGAGPSTGNYAVKITNTATGCVNTSAPVSVTINTQPATVSITPLSATICNGNNVLLTAGGGTSEELGNATIGTATTTTSTTTQPTAFCNRWPSYRIANLVHSGRTYCSRCYRRKQYKFNGFYHYK